MTNVKSPYNFVPLNKQVFIPKWGKYVTMDVPFKDALSGQIKLKITAKTPIFIRGKEETNIVIPTIGTTKIYQYRFKKLNGKYCIPGTSIKGELASVLENMSFGKLHRLNDSKYSLRDFNNSCYKNRMSNFNDNDKSKGGWLIKKDDSYYIEYNSKKPGRISHKTLDSVFNVSYVDTYSKKQKNKSALVKYRAFGSNLLTGKFSLDYNDANREICKVAENGKDGEIVFTGQASERKQITNRNGDRKWVGKHLEFIFWKPDQTPIKVNEQVIKDFFFAYFDHEPKSQSDDWKHWKKKLESGKKIPVFFLLKDEKVQHLGLSQLYKLPYKYRVTDLIKNKEEHNTNQLDLAECIFGHINQKENDSLKGRVSIEPALCIKESKELPVVNTILGSPKASYYPFYLRQRVSNETTELIGNSYNTYNDDSVLAGRKRYAVKTTFDTNNNLETPEKTTVSFFPLDKGVVFETIIHYHNLRPVELGALLSALSFHDTNACHHSLGMAKPLGYGNVQFEIDFNEVQKKKYMCMYEKMMEGFYAEIEKINEKWINSEQLKELFSIAKPVAKSELLEYMVLKDFANLKKSNNPKKALPKYSDFIENQHVTIQSLVTEECTYNYRTDVGKFIAKNNEIVISENYIDKQKSKLGAKIDVEITTLDLLIQQNIAKKLEKEIANRKAKVEADKVKATEDKNERVTVFKQTGIGLILEQTNIKNLISKTNTWFGNYYTNEEKAIFKTTTNNSIIPTEYITVFKTHVKSIYETKTKDRIWRIKKKLEYNDAFKYLVKCIGEEEALRWFKDVNLIKE